MPTINKPKRRYSAEPGGPRRKMRQKFYNSKAWKELRAAHLMKHPLCQICEMRGKTELATDVHHLRSWTRIKAGPERDAVALDPQNLASLCRTCHWSIHHGELKGCKSLDDVARRLESLSDEPPQTGPDENPGPKEPPVSLVF